MISGVPSLSFPGVNQIANDQVLPRSWGTAAGLSEGKLSLVGEPTGHRDIMEGGTYFPLPCRTGLSLAAAAQLPHYRAPALTAEGQCWGCPCEGLSHAKRSWSDASS